ncbi:MAG: hypothetical protein K6B13_02155, partial [Prevotella sp.]|nr:hypothetical protein [Prevotella sp.]
MKRLLSMLMAATLVTVCQAKKVKVTIDGTVPSTVSTIYLIINEDKDNAQLVPISDGKFSVTVKVDRDAFIRLDETKNYPQNSMYVLIPDSRHITIEWNKGNIQGSKLSADLQLTCSEIRSSSPDGFHVDVFSDDPEAWRRAQSQANAVRESMREQQRKIAREKILEWKNNSAGAWIVYCFPEVMEGELNAMIQHMKPKWINHPILK